MTDEITELQAKIRQLERENEVLREDIDDIAKQLEAIKKVLSLYYDEKKQTYKSKYLDRLYAMLKNIERKLSQ